MSNKRVLIITEEQYHLLINALNELRSDCIEKGISLEDVDELILKVIDTPLKKETSKDSIDAR